MQMQRLGLGIHAVLQSYSLREMLKGRADARTYMFDGKQPLDVPVLLLDLAVVATPRAEQ